MKNFWKIFFLKFKENLVLIKADKMIGVVIKGCFWVFLVSLFVLVLKWRGLPSEVPLFYSLPWGGQQLASSMSLIFLILFCAIFVFLNFIMAVFVFRNEVFLARALVFLGLTVSLLVGITVIKIVFLLT